MGTVVDVTPQATSHPDSLAALEKGDQVVILEVCTVLESTVQHV